ncbi:hypothetical protein Ade02nite_93860 [Paractinoplanes deccanensis]|uniref:DUF1542 domain-containing protein n=1 Tax=Paractinoplanes deccanensis TaxID=113561 RepID=A0ABQ3YLR9_9ACTN|nr:hypothetical protein [Actinoplanes deccanensis]GID80745.1 hypothetical protein Ade02nite_93860 [Actinoplanes deccanensis]
MALLVLALLFGVGALLVFSGRRSTSGQHQHTLSDARAEAQRWYERLGGQLVNLSSPDPAARQALADAAERHQAAGGQLARAETVRQYEMARETALEGLAYVRAARQAMGLDAGPEFPAAGRATGTLDADRRVTVQGQTYWAGPQASSRTPYYYPGGHVGGRPVPAGWYSTPWWKTALAAGAGALGGMMIFDALFGHHGFGGPGGGPGDFGDFF